MLLAFLCYTISLYMLTSLPGSKQAIKVSRWRLVLVIRHALCYEHILMNYSIMQGQNTAASATHHPLRPVLVLSKFVWLAGGSWLVSSGLITVYSLPVTLTKVSQPVMSADTTPV